MTGGGTLGPVTPLLGIIDVWKEMDEQTEFSWIVTPRGVEKDLLRSEGMRFQTLYAPKLSRHKKWQWIATPFLLTASVMRAMQILRKIRPSMVFTAGGYVSVPVVIAAKMQGIPIWVHQLDYLPGIANKVMAPFATRITTTFEKSAEKFPESKTETVGAVLRARLRISSKETLLQKYGLDPQKMTILITGGGTGAVQINDAMEVIAKELSLKANIIHLTGKGKMTNELQEIAPNYCAIEMVTHEMHELYSLADIVVSRAGLGTMMELVSYKKPAIIIPIKNSHQELNAAVLAEAGAAHVIWDMNPQVLKQAISKMIDDDDRRNAYARAIGEVMDRSGAEKIAKEAIDVLGGG